MNPLVLFATVATVHLLAVASPGPDFAMVTRQTLAHWRAAGLWTAWGIATGILFHIGYGLFGLGWLSQELPVLLDVLRYAGAAFLITMGWNGLRARPRDPAGATEPAPAAIARGRHFGIGVLTNVLNPKATLYFIALFSSVITAQLSMPLRLGLGAWILLETGAWFSFVALTLGHRRVRAALLTHAHWIDRVTGAILVALGLAMLIAKL